MDKTNPTWHMFVVHRLASTITSTRSKYRYNVPAKKKTGTMKKVEDTDITAPQGSGDFKDADQS
jgi:hypothetical protein